MAEVMFMTCKSSFTSMTEKSKERDLCSVDNNCTALWTVKDNFNLGITVLQSWMVF